jgi:hypothetical protein
MNATNDNHVSVLVVGAGRWASCWRASSRAAARGSA